MLMALGLFFALTGCPGPQDIHGGGGGGGDDPGTILQYYTVVYDANGGEGEMESSSFPIGSLKKLEPNAFTKTGFVFLGWSTTKDGAPEYANKDAVEDLSLTPNETVTLYAVWGAPNTYTVVYSYNVDNENQTMPPSIFTLGDINTLPLNTFTRTGYTFEGWAAEPDSEVIYTDGQIVGYLTTKAGETVYLYAVWKPITYTVVYDANGGEGAMANTVFTYDEPQALTANGLHKAGMYLLAGLLRRKGRWNMLMKRLFKIYVQMPVIQLLYTQCGALLFALILTTAARS